MTQVTQVKPAFHDADIDTDVPTRPTRLYIFTSDTRDFLLAMMSVSVSRNAALMQHNSWTKQRSLTDFSFVHTASCASRHARNDTALCRTAPDLKAATRGAGRNAVYGAARTRIRREEPRTFTVRSHCGARPAGPHCTISGVNKPFVFAWLWLKQLATDYHSRLKCY